MSEVQLNLHTFFTERELGFLPTHFVVSKTPITSKSKLWIIEKLSGRFCLVESANENSDSYPIDFYPQTFPAFEDPQEAIVYELTWG